LSVTDLIEAGTLSTEMAALCWLRVEDGVSFITGALRGGAGKTTLMAAILAFLPPNETIVTVGDRRVIDAALAGRLPLPATALAHEIGSGAYFGYIWGRDAADFFRVGESGVRRVTCMHADTPREAREKLLALGVRKEDWDAIEMQLYIRRTMHVRRVTSLHCRIDGRLEPVYVWEPASDAFARHSGREEVSRALAVRRGATAEQVEEAWSAREAFLEALLRDGVRDYAEVRRRVVEFCGG